MPDGRLSYPPQFHSSFHAAALRRLFWTAKLSYNPDSVCQKCSIYRTDRTVWSTVILFYMTPVPLSPLPCGQRPPGPVRGRTRAPCPKTRSAGCKKAERAAGVATAARSFWPGPHGPDQIPFSIWRYRLPAAPSARAEAGRGVRAAAKAAGRAEWGINAAGFAARCRAPPRSSCKCRRHCPAVAKFRRAAR